jgi:hypothetical protein
VTVHVAEGRQAQRLGLQVLRAEQHVLQQGDALARDALQGGGTCSVVTLVLRSHGSSMMGSRAIGIKFGLPRA